MEEFADPEDFFAEKRADLAVIASPDRVHVPQALRALELGYDILLEKLISDSREEIRALVGAQAYVKGMWADMELSHPSILAKCSHDLDLLVNYADSQCDTLSSVGELCFFKEENCPADAADLSKRNQSIAQDDFCFGSRKTYCFLWNLR